MSNNNSEQVLQDLLDDGSTSPSAVKNLEKFMKQFTKPTQKTMKRRGNRPLSAADFPDKTKDWVLLLERNMNRVPKSGDVANFVLRQMISNHRYITQHSTKLEIVHRVASSGDQEVTEMSEKWLTEFMETVTSPKFIDGYMDCCSDKRGISLLLSHNVGQRGGLMNAVGHILRCIQSPTNSERLGAVMHELVEFDQTLEDQERAILCADELKYGCKKGVNASFVAALWPSVDKRAISRCLSPPPLESSGEPKECPPDHTTTTPSE
jgi:hypothetical protein